jgi:hypothetical protein
MAEISALFHLPGRRADRAGRRDETPIPIKRQSEDVSRRRFIASSSGTVEGTAPKRSSTCGSTRTLTASISSRAVGRRSGSNADFGRSIAACRASFTASGVARRKTLVGGSASRAEPEMPRPLQRARLESGLKLDLNKLRRQGGVQPGAKIGPHVIRWANTYTGEEFERFNYREHGRPIPRLVQNPTWKSGPVDRLDPSASAFRWAPVVL